jgi:hypothetical protein
MQRPLVLPHEVICHYLHLMHYRCKNCGGFTYPLRVLYPAVRLNDNEAEVSYPVVCGCNRRACLQIRLPVLLFGYVLARTQALEAFARRNQSKASMCVVPQPSKALEDMVADFARVMAAYDGGPAGQPTDLDRINFGLGEAEWSDFLRRLGLDGGTEASPNH